MVNDTHRDHRKTWIAIFLADLRENGNVLRAARVAQVDRSHVYYTKREYRQTFGILFDQALEAYRLKYEAAERRSA